jgi:hypothetical protein
MELRDKIGLTSLFLCSLLLISLTLCEPLQSSLKPYPNVFVYILTPDGRYIEQFPSSPVIRNFSLIKRIDTLTLEITEVKRSPAEFTINLSVRAIWSSSDQNSFLELFAYSHLKSYQPTLFSFPCNMKNSVCEVNENIPIAVSVEHESMFPFDSVNISHIIESNPSIEWQKIEIQNTIPDYEIHETSQIEPADETLSLSLSLGRPTKKKFISLLLLAVWIIYIVLCLLLKDKLMTKTIGFALLFLITLTLRITFLTGSLILPSILDISMIFNVCICMLCLIRRKKLLFTLSQMFKQKTKRSIFISYRREDAEIEANLIYNKLEIAFPNNRVFIDQKNISPGTVFPEEIEKTISSADAFLPVIGPYWLKGKMDKDERAIDRESDWPRQEAELAIEKGVPIIPVLVGSTKWPEASELPQTLEPLSNINAIKLRGDTLDQDIAKLISVIKQKTNPNLDFNYTALVA